MASFARDLLGHKYFQECNGGSKEVETQIWKQLLQQFFSACHNLMLFFSLVENGGAADQDKKREADFHSLLCFSLQRSARKVLTRLSASWQTPVSRTFFLCGEATLINVECKWDWCIGSWFKWQLLTKGKGVALLKAQGSAHFHISVACASDGCFKCLCSLNVFIHYSYLQGGVCDHHSRWFSLPFSDIPHS